jgi:hypothetical protein
LVIICSLTLNLKTTAQGTRMGRVNWVEGCVSAVGIGIDAARLIRQTTSHGNDYLKRAKVIIVTK